ncbi:DUF1573 domain-containing protein [Rubinisphaera margarita]|uniref:DUF1573 domain-containing protein n=1 Tax=Rubinisphaera margarita TaxID=2909586 RepID=UPI0036F303C1
MVTRASIVASTLILSGATFLAIGVATHSMPPMLTAIPDKIDGGDITDTGALVSFTLVNNSDEVVLVQCDCTQVDLDRAHIPPHSTKNVSLQWNPNGEPGPVDTTINIHYYAERNPRTSKVLILQIFGTIRPSDRPSPPS